MILQKLKSLEQIQCPGWLPDNTSYLTVMGSVAYGVSSDNSDMDVYGFCFPPKDLAFPHLAGEIPGFGHQVKRFEQWQQHHIRTPDGKQTYDFVIYSIIKYFHLCMENNPNMIDSLFTPRRCVIHSTAVSELVRSRRTDFLHKGAWAKFKGYAYQQMHKIRNKKTAKNPKRAESIEQFGFDVKYAYHLVRLLGEVEQILIEHDLDLERNSEQLKSIRRGEWTLEQIETYFEMKERGLEEVYMRSDLRATPDEDKVRRLLLECLEQHYGSLDRAVRTDKSVAQLIGELQTVMQKYQES